MPWPRAFPWAWGTDSSCPYVTQYDMLAVMFADFAKHAVAATLSPGYGDGR